VGFVKPHNASALALAVVIVLSGARVLRDRDNRVCVTTATARVPEGTRPTTFSAGSLIVETAGSIREEPEVEHHLRVEKARGSLRSYLTEVLGPRVGFPLRRGTNGD
jgi:hypothetical protein